MSNVVSPDLHSRYAQIFCFFRRRTHSDAAAEDLTQQVFTEAVASSRALDLGLLFTIAKRRLIDDSRKRKFPTVPLEHAFEAPTRNQGLPDAAAEIVDAIKGLDPIHQQVVVLKLVRGLSFAEVGEIVGASEPACKMRLRRALEILRRSLEEKGIQP